MDPIANIFSHRLYDNHETLTRILVYEIRSRNPEAIQFVATTQVIKSILFHLKMKRFDTLMYLYGFKFVLEILKLLEEWEVYEICADIKSQIDYHNEIIGDNIPTK